MINALAARGEGAAAELSPEDFSLEEGAIRVIEDTVFDLFTLMSGHTYADFFPLSTERDVLGPPTSKASCASRRHALRPIASWTRA